MDFDAVNRELMNWGLSIRDDWANHLGYAPPPTSDQYVAPISVHDEPEPRAVVDERDAEVANHVIISIGCEPGWFDHFRVIVRWYTRLAFQECTHDERIKRLSKHMKCSFPAAQTMLTDAQRCYNDRREVLDNLKRETKRLQSSGMGV